MDALKPLNQTRCSLLHCFSPSADMILPKMPFGEN